MHPLAFSCNTHNDLDLVDIVYIHYRSFDARMNIICVVGNSFVRYFLRNDSECI